MELIEFILARVAEEEEASRIARRVPDAAQNITRWHPARVLAQVEAMRRIVAECAHVASKREGTHAAELALYTLRALATIWREHEQYDPAWEA